MNAVNQESRRRHLKAHLATAKSFAIAELENNDFQWAALRIVEAAVIASELELLEEQIDEREFSEEVS